MAETQVPTAPVAPYLTVNDGNAAVAFYEKAFGATLIHKMSAQDGKRLMHAALNLNGGLLMLSDDFTESPELHRGGARSPKAIGGSAVTIHIETDDADRWWKRAVDAGASVIMPLENMFWGARYGQLKDPFGHLWSIGGPVKPDK